MKEYIEKNLQDEVLDIKRGIHVTTSTRQLVSAHHQNRPTGDEVALLLPSHDSISQEHTRYVLFCKKGMYKPCLSLN